MQKVLKVMRITVKAKTCCRPYLSPKTPKNMPPSGRIKNGTEKVAKVAISWRPGVTSGKKTPPRTVTR
ncbi:histone-lysine n-methyltransferase setdb1 isoform x1 [Lasius niger]|uniref:Histone-lysine n-methyltransferase setdb1 isoform x1 n=1 Tax=Lasius niger TaxID=67767 RepID=A0A0J7JZE7_LASNI|nr:histone-lysine n-methyltransferase setdb1 isoform x1 [Lasius niger]